MAEHDDSDWKDEDFIPQQDPMQELRDWILRQLLAEVPRSQIEDELVRQGETLEFAISLIDSVQRTHSHDGTSEVVVTRLRGVSWSQEDPLAAQRRDRAERAARRARAMSGSMSEPNPDLAFQASADLYGEADRQDVRGRRKFLLVSGLLAVGFILVLSVAFYVWMAIS